MYVSVYAKGKFIDILGGNYEVKKIKDKKMGKGIEIRFVDMDAPKFTFKNLVEISKFFGTKDIDFNDSINVEGCPTCGSGEEFGYLIEVYNITKNFPFEND